MTLQCFTKYRFRAKFWTPHRTYRMQIESPGQSRARIQKPFPYIPIQIEPPITFRESKTKYCSLIFWISDPNRTLPIPYESEYRSSMIKLPDPNKKPLKIWILITKLFNSRQDWPFKWYSSIEDWFCRKTSQVWWGTDNQLRWEASWADTSSYSPPCSLYIWTYDTAQSFAAKRDFYQRVRNIPEGLEYTLGVCGTFIGKC